MALCEACGKPRPRNAVAFCSMACYHANHRKRSAEERFWSHVQKGGGCWTWRGAEGRSHAPTFGADPHNPRSVTRYSWELHHGPIPAGLYVLHRCDNPPCVRPDHLFLGTAAENTRDMYAKGRNFDLGGWVRANPGRSTRKSMPGALNPAAKLTEADVTEIRRLYSHGLRQVDLARAFGVSQPHISTIVRREAWR